MHPCRSVRHGWPARRAWRGLLAALTTAALAGCSSGPGSGIGETSAIGAFGGGPLPYQASSVIASSGYSESLIGPDRYRIEVKGPLGTPRQRMEKIAATRASRIGRSQRAWASTASASRSESVSANRRVRQCSAAAATSVAANSHSILAKTANVAWPTCRATGRAKKLAVDHDHKTGEVRGLCCGICNNVLGLMARDDPSVFDRAADYLRNPPARRVLGVIIVEDNVAEEENGYD